MKLTKIICSIGPASNQPDVMEQMINNGMNIARLNFSHATLEEKEQVIKWKKYQKTKLKLNATMTKQ